MSDICMVNYTHMEEGCTTKHENPKDCILNQSQRAPAPSESPSPATVTDAETLVADLGELVEQLDTLGWTKAPKSYLGILSRAFHALKAVGPALARLAEYERGERT